MNLENKYIICGKYLIINRWHTFYDVYNGQKNLTIYKEFMPFPDEDTLNKCFAEEVNTLPYTREYSFEKLTDIRIDDENEVRKIWLKWLKIVNTDEANLLYADCIIKVLRE